MNDKIASFLKKQTVASISCLDEENNPYSFTCFFAYNALDHLLYFKSSALSYHTQLLMINPIIAGTILPDQLNKLAIKGIQFTGTLLKRSNALCTDATSFYHKKFPYAVAVPGEVSTIQLERIKMTDNALGFGKKITWSRFTVCV